jgi:hypothetical protein
MLNLRMPPQSVIIVASSNLWWGDDGREKVAVPPLSHSHRLHASNMNGFSQDGGRGTASPTIRRGREINASRPPKAVSVLGSPDDGDGPVSTHRSIAVWFRRARGSMRWGRGARPRVREAPRGWSGLIDPLVGSERGDLDPGKNMMGDD